jgi:hypothetical protein
VLQLQGHCDMDQPRPEETAGGTHSRQEAGEGCVVCQQPPRSGRTANDVLSCRLAHTCGGWVCQTQLHKRKLALAPGHGPTGGWAAAAAGRT